MKPPPPDVVEMTLPADPRFFRLARMTASGVAADLGATEDAMMELRLAVDEACAVLIEHAGEHDRLKLECTVDDGHIVIVLTSSAARSDGPLRPHPVAEAILAWSVASFEVGRDAEGHDLIRLVQPLRR